MDRFGESIVCLGMIVGLRLTLRTAGICLLGIVSSMSAPASVQLKLAPSQPAPFVIDSTILVAAPPVAWFHVSTNPCLRSALTVSPSSAAPRLTRRIFVEDSTSLSGNALKTVRLQDPMRPQVCLPPEPPALRTNSYSVANRQRAP